MKILIFLIADFSSSKVELLSMLLLLPCETCASSLLSRVTPTDKEGQVEIQTISTASSDTFGS